MCVKFVLSNRTINLTVRIDVSNVELLRSVVIGDSVCNYHGYRVHFCSPQPMKRHENGM